MTYLVDANVLSEPTKPDPDPRVISLLRKNEANIVVDPFILGEIQFGILQLPPGKTTALVYRSTVVTRNRRDFKKAGVKLINPFD